MHVAEIRGLVMQRVTKCHQHGFQIKSFLQTVVYKSPSHILAITAYIVPACRYLAIHFTFPCETEA